MARDKLSVDLDLNIKNAARNIEKLEKQAKRLGLTLGKGFGGTGGGGADKVRALGTGLSKATVRADEFSKSLEASNARVIAFGASAGIIMNVERALKAMVKSAITVEKAMADIAVVMGGTNQQLEQFEKGLFKVAKSTAQSFSVVAEAGVELARQGLGMEKTLGRANDALILTRLTGMNAADAVKSLTAAVNSFNKEGVTSAEVVNRMAKVDAAFAVSSEDLAKAISRVGASAVSAGVSMNELMAITTAVQQRTARGGAVIGNAFKTIFTRIQRSDVQQRLENIGVATRDMNGKMLSGIKVIENLARSFDGLTKAQQSSVSEQVAGVFQVNILKAAMADLSQANSVYKGSLQAANSAVDEAYVKNERLNQTLDALVNKTLANLTQAGASLGAGMFGPAIENSLGTVNSIIESFGEGGKMEKFGEGFGSDILKGLGKFIGGPGLIAVTAVFGKLFLQLGKYAGSALKDVIGITAASKQREALEKSIVETLQREPGLYEKSKSGAKGLKEVQEDILQTMQAQALMQEQIISASKTIAGAAYAGGARVSKSGSVKFKGPGKAGGFVPNFANPNAERAAAAAGGYQAGAIRTMNQPGIGSMMYNSAETVKQFPGMSQSAIMPPQGSPAGAGYRAAFGAAHGFDPYAAGGFIPNFARPPVTGLKRIGGGKYTADKSGKLSAKSKQRAYDMGGDLSVAGGLEGGIAMLVPDGQPNQIGSFVSGTGKYKNFRASIPIRSYNKETLDKLTPNDIVSDISKAVANETMNYAMTINPPARDVQLSEVMRALDSTKGAKGALTAAAGAGFEVGLNLALDAKAAAEENTIGDFDVRGNQAAKSHPIFGGGYGIADYKASRSRGNQSSFANKMAKELVEGGPGGASIIHMQKDWGKALGFVPNFSPVTTAIGRELAAGVPASAIRVGHSSALRTSGNPSGAGVYNTIHEPGGLNQGIRRSIRSGIDPTVHGAAGGYVPNFVAGALLSKLGGGFKAGLGMAGSTIGFGMMGQAGGQAGSSEGLFGRLAGAGLAGSIGGLPGVLGGVALQGLTEVIGLLTTASEDSTVALKEEVEAQEELLNKSLATAEGFGKLAESMSAAEFVSKKQAALGDLGIGTGNLVDKDGGSTKTDHPMYNTPELKNLQTSTRANFANRLAAYNTRLQERTALKAAGGAKGALANLMTPDAQAQSDFYAYRNRVAPQVETNVGEGGVGFFTPNPKIRTARFRQSAEGREFFRLRGLMSGVGNVGGSYASQFLGNLGPNYSPESVLARQAAMGNDPRLVIPQTGVEGRNAMLSQLTGMSSDDIAQGLQPAWADLMRAVGAQTITMEQADNAFRDIQMALIAAYSDQETYNKFVKEGADAKAKENKESVNYAESIRKAMLAQEAYRQEVFQSKRALAGLTRQVAQDQAMFGLGAGSRRATANATMTRGGAARVNRDIAIEQAKLVRKGAIEIADAAVKQDVKEGLKDLNVVKFIQGQKFGATQANEALAAFQALRGGVKDADQKTIDAQLEKLAAVQGVKLEKGVIRSRAEATDLAFLDKIIATLIKAQEKHILTTDKINDTQTNSIELAKEKFRVDTEAIKLQYKINEARRQETREIAASVKTLEFGEAKRLTESGQMGARGRASAYEAARAARIAAHGADTRDIGRAFRSGFGGEMGYAPVDALDDLRDGSRQVAQSMKSSFADAFQSIASGASSASAAMAGMAQSILNSISQVSSNMFTNMLFNSAFGNLGPNSNTLMPQGAHGGLIRGYAGGGVVTGGSGYKDDVITKMQGGEYVIKKSAAQKIGYGTLNAINMSATPGYSNGGSTGPTMGQVGLVAAGASAASGIIGAMTQERPDKPLPMRDYGYGRSQYGFLGGPDPDAGSVDSAMGGGGRAAVSLSKGYVFYRRDPRTGRLVSERRRPTEGRFEVSSSLSLLGRLGGEDPQTARMFEKEQSMSKYQDYLAQETQSRKDQIAAAKKQKRGALIQGYANAAMLIGGSYLMSRSLPTKQSPELAAQTGGIGSADPANWGYAPGYDIGSMETTAAGARVGRSMRSMPTPPLPPGFTGSSNIYPGNANGGLAKVMGGEYIMSPEAVRTYGVNFMGELNRGNMPGYANGGPVGAGISLGNQGADMGAATLAGNTTNNVKISVNIDKTGKAEASTEVGQSGSEADNERDEMAEVENNKALGEMLQSAVLDEIIKQQRPGGLLQNSN